MHFGQIQIQNVVFENTIWKIPCQDQCLNFEQQQIVGKLEFLAAASVWKSQEKDWANLPWYEILALFFSSGRVLKWDDFWIKKTFACFYELFSTELDDPGKQENW